jgi:hypothetical protein
MKSTNNTNRIYVTKNFSNFDTEESIDEAFDFLKGKARLYGDVEQAITDAGAFFDSYMGDPNQKAAAESAKSKTDKVLADLKSKKPKDHERSDYRGFLDGIEKAKSEFKDKQNQILSKIKEYADVAKIIEEASKMSEEAAKKATDINIEISKKKDERNIKLKDAIKLSKTLKKDEVKGKNEEINKIQKEFIRKFESNPKVKDSAIFKKIKDAVETKKQGGFFGPTTEKIIKGLKAGFGMDDKSSDITQELINKIYTEKIEESNGFRSIKGFSDFDVMNEDFDVNKFLEVVGEKGKDTKEEKIPSLEEVRDSMNKATEEIYNKNKEAVDYILGKDFEPSKDGEKEFEAIFGVKWEDFKKYNDKQKRNTIVSGLRSNIIPLTKEVKKDTIDLYFKK